jgi:serine/threonine-protein phosphatase 2A regulatory subunit B'
LADNLENTGEDGEPVHDDEAMDILQKDMEEFDNSGNAQRFRRKSVLPVDETVLSELSRHRSLEEVITQKTEGESSLENQ